MDRFQAAGRRAEEQMAFYLRRYFGERPDIIVLNDLKVMCSGEFAQIDHLIVTPSCFVLIESKSVSGVIRVTREMQWIREFQGYEKGMMSPYVQVEMQSMVLYGNLQRYTCREWLPEDSFGLIAISDSGVIKYPDNVELKSLLKADQVPARVEALSRRTIEDESKEEAKRLRLVKIASYLVICNDLARNLKPFAKPGGISNRAYPGSCAFDGSDNDGEWKLLFEIAIEGFPGLAEPKLFSALEGKFHTDAFEVLRNHSPS
jgi:hypothetical protein